MCNWTKWANEKMANLAKFSIQYKVYFDKMVKVKTGQFDEIANFAHKMQYFPK